MLNWSKFFVFTSIFLIAGVGYGQTTVIDFNDAANWVAGSGSITSYQSDHQYNSNNWNFTGGPALRNTTSATDGFPGALGSYSWRLRDASGMVWIATYNNTGTNTISDFGFKFRRWDSSPTLNHTVSYSTDGGSNWTTAGTLSASSSDWQTFSHNLASAVTVTSGQFKVRVVRSGGERVMIDDFQWSIAPPANITASSISGGPFTVDCAGPTPASGTFSFTSSGSFNAGNVFSAELSDGTVLGTLISSGANPSGAISITVPANLATGNYDIVVTSSDPVSTSNNLTFSLIQNCEPPHLKSLVLNSCNTVCSEGNNELIFGSSGDYSVTLNSANLTVTYGSSASPTTDYTDPFVSNSAKTNSLNTDAGCSGLFLDGLNVTVAPNSKFMIISNDFCSGDGLDLSSLCGSGPIYVMYSTDPSWSSSGNFTNSTSAGTRYLQSSISTTSALFIIDYSFDSGLNSGSDGDYVKWNSTGGLASEAGNNGCTLNAALLPIELTEFNGYLHNNSVMLTWTTLSELNNDYFRLYHSMNGKVFEEIGSVPGSGTTSSSLNYSFKHRNPTPDINYYKLKSVDYDGTVHDKGIIAVQVEMNHVFYDQITQSIQMNYSSDYAVYGSDGRLITRVENQNAIPFSGHGIFHVIDERSGKAFKLGVW